MSKKGAMKVKDKKQEERDRKAEEMQQMASENDQLEEIIKKKEALVARFAKVSAQEKLAGMNVPPLDETEDVDEDESNQDDFSKLNDFERTLKAFSDEAEGSIEIYRMTDSGVQAKMGTFPVKEWGHTLEKCAKSFGGGEYIAILRNGKGQWAGKTTAHYDMIAYPKPNPNAQPQPMAVNTGADTTEVLKLMQQQQTEQNEKFFGLMTTIITSMGNKSMAEPKNGLISSLQDVVVIKELFSPKDSGEKKEESPLKQLDSLLSIFQKGLDHGQSMAPAGEKEEDGILSLIKSFAPALLEKTMNMPPTGPQKNPLSEVLEKLKRAKLTPPMPTPPIAGVPPLVKDEAPKPLQTGEIKPPTGGNSMINLMIQMYKGTILDMANQSFDPEKMAEILLLRIPQDHWLMCQDFIQNSERYAIACQYIPELSAHKVWCNAVLDKAKILLKEAFADTSDGTNVVDMPPVETSLPEDIIGPKKDTETVEIIDTKDIKGKDEDKKDK